MRVNAQPAVFWVQPATLQFVLVGDIWSEKEHFVFQQSPGSFILLAVILVIVLARVVFVNSGGRGSGGGIAGMALCRKCGRAFPRSVLSPNLVTGKLVHCPHCGAWAILPAASQAELDLAAAREKGPETPAAPAVSQEEELRRRIEQSNYEQ